MIIVNSSKEEILTEAARRKLVNGLSQYQEFLYELILRPKPIQAYTPDELKKLGMDHMQFVLARDIETVAWSSLDRELFPDKKPRCGTCLKENVLVHLSLCRECRRGKIIQRIAAIGLGLFLLYLIIH
jgi:hypothetical protein